MCTVGGGQSRCVLWEGSDLMCTVEGGQTRCVLWEGSDLMCTVGGVRPDVYCDTVLADIVDLL